MAAEEQLSAAQRSKVRRLSQPKEISADEEGGELNIIPFLDIIMNVLMFVLASVSVTFISIIDVPPPRQSNRSVSRPPEQDQLQLTVIVQPTGIVVMGKDRTFGAGCTESGPPGRAIVDVTGVAHPSAGESQETLPWTEYKFDADALGACAKELKTKYPTEKSVTITTTTGMPYQTIIHVIDALRGKVGDEMFPEVTFALLNQK